MTGAVGAADTAPQVDLHSHSVASDGSFTPAQVVEAAHKAGLAAIALTDHDTLAGIAEAKETAVTLGIRLVPGVELSVHQGQREIHLLGLHIRDVDELQQNLSNIREGRRTRAEQMVAELNRLGVVISMEDVLTQAAGGAIGRPHVARALIASGAVRDSHEAFSRFLAAGRPAYVDKARLDIVDGIQMIHKAGGLAVIAHPADEGTRERLTPLVDAGLDGIEVLHPSHNKEDVARLRTLAGFFGVVPSGGSDWHGATSGYRVLGSMKVPLEWLEHQDNRVSILRGE